MQIVGIFAVVLSLIFIGLQMRQTQEIAIASQYQDRASLNAELKYAQIQSDTALHVAGNSLSRRLSGSASPEELAALLEGTTPDVLGYRDTIIRATLLLNDNNHFQYQSGFLTEETWHAYRDELGTYLRSPLFRLIWYSSKHEYRADFQNVVEQLILENDREP